jgi:hypothetical protein
MNDIVFNQRPYKYGKCDEDERFFFQTMHAQRLREKVKQQPDKTNNVIVYLIEGDGY